MIFLIFLPNNKMQKIGQKQQMPTQKLGTKMATPQKLGSKRDESMVMRMVQPMKERKIEKE
jgi:hypothetical protein